VSADARRRPAPGATALALAAALLATLALAAAPLIAAAQSGGDSGERHVVILNSTDPYLPAFVEIDRGLREAIQALAGRHIQLHAETLDMHRFPQALLDQDMVNLLRKKYRGLRVDVVVTVATIALDFARAHAAEIWPGAAIVFNSIPAAALPERNLDAAISGIPVSIDFDATIDIALGLLPETRQIAVIAGSSEPDRRVLAQARESLEHYQGKYQLRYLDGLTLADTIAAVRTLPQDTIVLYLMMFRDGAGTPLVPREALAEIAQASAAPVFGAFETYLGNGIVAGSITSYRAQGRRTGELAVRILDGQDPASIGVQQPGAPGCIADWQQLRRWRLDADLLPDGCEVRFREFSAWERYHWQIIAVLIVLLVQAAMIVALMLNRRRLDHARRELLDEGGRRKQAETMVTDLRGRLARFGKERSLGTMATAISHEINQPLAAIQNYAQAARKRLESNADDVPKLVELFNKIEGQAERAGAITRRVRALVNNSDVQLQPVAVRPLVEEVTHILAPELAQYGCRIELDLAADLPAALAEPLELQLVLVNLMQNSIHSLCSCAARDRSVTIEVHAADRGEVQFSVIDRGGGVAPEQIADLFEPLASGTLDGMGMGLAIARTIIDAHGGRLWYEANPQGGAIFRFTLLLAQS